MSANVSDSQRQCGSYVKYKVDSCRCQPCTKANRDYTRDLAARLEPPYITAGPARRHVKELMAAGMGPRTIAKASGVSHGAISKLIYGDYKGRGPSKRIRRETATKLMAVTPSAAADGTKIDATQTWQLLDEMIDAGTPKSQIAKALGAKSPGLQISRNQVEAGTARDVAVLHARWLTGDIEFPRRDRHGNTTTITPPVPVPVELDAALARRDEIDALYSELADIIEARNARTWRNQAACRGRPVHLWFPATGDRATLAAARDICSACFVREQCLAENRTVREGVYGGLGYKARIVRDEAAS